VVPLECNLDDLKKGSQHYHWDDSLPLYFGLLPRRNPKPEDVRWFQYKNSHIIHVGNAYDGPNGVVYMDSPVTHTNGMARFFPNKNISKEFDPLAPIPHQYVRWELDPKAKSDFVEPKLLADVNGEYPTVDPRFACREYTYVFMACFDETISPERRPYLHDLTHPRFIYDSVSRANVKTGKYDLWRAGENIVVQEPVFIPRSATCEEGDGHVIVFLSHLDTMLSSLAILDTECISAGPVARILLPFRLKSGIHGSWVFTCSS
jgi:carotenoid cleavage dioxygenase-like enzyme